MNDVHETIAPDTIDSVLKLRSAPDVPTEPVPSVAEPEAESLAQVVADIMHETFAATEPGTAPKTKAKPARRKAVRPPEAKPS